MYAFDEFELDLVAEDLRHRGQPVKAETTVVRLLCALVRRGHGQLVTKDELVEEVWGGRTLADNAITVCVARLRKMLREHGGHRDYISSVYARGYRFMRPVKRIGGTTFVGAGSASLQEPPEEAPCVGRERVLARLDRLWESAQGSHGSACVIMGEPGIGKTKVVETFADRLGDSAQIVWAYCRDTGTPPPLSPWLRLLRTAAADAWTQGFEHALGGHAARVRGWLGLDATRGELPHLTTPLSNAAAARADRYATYDAILQTLALLARPRGLCLVLDDLQWADAASLELLDLALDEIAQTRILLLCTMRKLPSFQMQRAQTHLPAVLGHRNCERINLSRLSKTEVTEYLDARLPGDERGLANAVFANSEGVPFFMVELVRQLETSDAAPDELSVPGAALELFRARVSKLAEPAQRLLRAAATIGRAFELSLLEELCGLSPANLLAAIDEAIAHDILVSAPGSSSGFAFGHELMRRAIYDSVPVAERRHMHLRVAEAMERRGGADEEANHELAYHLHAALPEADPVKAAKFCERAAYIAGAAYANTDAVTHLCHALEALDLLREPATYQRAKLHMIKVMYSRGQVGYRESLEAVRRYAGELKHGQLLALAACMYHPHPALQPLPGGVAVVEQALEVLGSDLPGSRGACLALRACYPPECFDRATVEARLSEAEALVRSAGDVRAMYPLLLAELHLTGGRAQVGHRAKLRGELTELARQYPDVMRVLPIDVAFDLAMENAQRGRLRDAEANLVAASRLARAINHSELQWHASRMRAWARVDQGQVAQGSAELAALHRRAARHEVAGVGLFCAFDRCMLQPDTSSTQPLDDDDLWALRHEPEDPLHIRAMKIRALARAGYFQEARSALHEIPASRLAAVAHDGQLAGSLAQLARASIVLEEREHAAAIADLLAGVSMPYAINIAYRSEGSVAATLGDLLAFLQQHEAARPHLERGHRLNESAGLLGCSEGSRHALAASTAMVCKGR